METLAPQPPRSKMGKVFLVGAGPGDPGLITVRGLQCIEAADDIVYDFLVNPLLLNHARAGVDLLCVGKRCGCHSMKQAEINALLVSFARQGREVCRLKGGDPFVYGRGGEEALALAEAGIPFEIVPGVSAAVAVPAYAGIPVTHRGIAGLFHVVTGHEDPWKKGGSVDWDALVQSTGTLVFLMGLNRLGAIAARLQTGVRSADVPAAVIAQGTLPEQRTVVGTLETIAERAARERIGPPAIIVVGEVVSLRDSLAWFEELLVPRH